MGGLWVLLGWFGGSGPGLGGFGSPSRSGWGPGAVVFLALVRTCSGIHDFQSSAYASEAPNWGFGAERACLFAQVSIWTTTMWLLTGLPPFYSCRRPCLPSQQHRSHGRSGPAKGGLHIGRHRAQCLLLTVEGPLKFSGARAGMYRRRPAPAPIIIINKEPCGAVCNPCQVSMVAY